MPDQSRLPEIQRLDKEIEYTRTVCRASLKLLKASSPDAFLGRKTQEPFPLELAHAEGGVLLLNK